MVHEFTSHLLQVNPYDRRSFEQEFSGNPILGMLPTGITPVWSRSGTYDPEHHSSTTPRWRHMHGYFTMASFYYLGFIMREHPTTVADIGCGENVFKAFYPQIVGYDPFIPSADHEAYFDDDFASANRRAFDSAFACNSIHFSSMGEFPRMLDLLASTVKPGGIVHATANLTRFLDAEATAEGREHGYAESVDMALRADSMLRSLGLDWLVVDQCYDGIYPGDLDFNNGILGNLRLVFRV